MSLARGILVTTNKLESVLNCLLQLDILVLTLLDPLPPLQKISAMIGCPSHESCSKQKTHILKT